jgi:hypothetical protein
LKKIKNCQAIVYLLLKTELFIFIPATAPATMIEQKIREIIDTDVIIHFFAAADMIRSSSSLTVRLKSLVIFES